MTKSRSNRKKAKKKHWKSLLIFLVLSTIMALTAIVGYPYAQNYLQERNKAKTPVPEQQLGEIIRLEINEADTITSLAKKINKRFPKLNLTDREIVSALNDRTRIQTLKQTYPFIPERVLDSTIQYPLEGLFVPLTYEYYENDTLDTIIKKPLDEMNRIYQQYNTQLEQQGYSFYDALIQASITNAEVPSNDQVNMKMVSQVFKNRLNQGIGLGSDATLVYALNKKELTQDDFSQNQSNLYNTRSNLKLPPTPIQFVTIAALDSVLQSTPNDYLYFLTGTCNGRDDYQKFFYSTTYDEHNINIQNHMVC